jgi:hypothetical protein
MFWFEFPAAFALMFSEVVGGLLMSAARVALLFTYVAHHYLSQSRSVKPSALAVCCSLTCPTHRFTCLYCSGGTTSWP